MKITGPLLLATSVASTAATVVSPYENPGTDGVAFPYEFHVTFSETDAWNTTTSVGGWSYVDLDPVKNQNRGWGHASSWYLVEIAEATRFQLTLSSSDPSSRPGFVLFAGESVEDTPGSLHTYSNNGNDMATLNGGWDQNATPLSYVTHAFNTSGASVTGEVELAPGRYTLAVGNGADSSTNPGGRTLDLAFTTVPEPSVALLGALGSLGLLRRRR